MIVDIINHAGKDAHVSEIYRGETLDLYVACDPATLSLPRIPDQLHVEFHQVAHTLAELQALQGFVDDYVNAHSYGCGICSTVISLEENAISVDNTDINNFDPTPLMPQIKDRFFPVDCIPFVQASDEIPVCAIAESESKDNA